jgi:hypothetical protein
MVSTGSRLADPTRIKDGILSLSTSIRTKSSRVADLVRSEDRLFFIAYAQEKSQARKEWKLARVDFQRPLQQYPNCLHDGRFFMEFFIEHQLAFQWALNPYICCRLGSSHNGRSFR